MRFFLGREMAADSKHSMSVVTPLEESLMPRWSLLGELFRPFLPLRLLTEPRFKVPAQAFIDVQSADNSALDYNSNGIVGLAFTRHSLIDNTVGDTEALKGRSLLYNIFDLYPEEPNFIAFALQRDKDGGDEVEGSFSIGMHVQERGLMLWTDLRFR